MAETASVLARPEQKVFMPEDKAGCIMSNMAPHALVSAVLQKLTAQGRKLIPLTYVNSSAEVKAVCAQYGGAACTSANAKVMLAWALSQGDGALFLPDKMLAENTCNQLGIAPAKRGVIDISQGGESLDLAAAKDLDVLFWPGHCVIHFRFRPYDIEKARSECPGALVVVHPECPPETVALADSCGSTSHIIRFVNQAPEGSTIYIGTEINLVKRLAERVKNEKTVLPLRASTCINMAKTTEYKLAKLLSDLDGASPVRVREETAQGSLAVIECMLEVSAKP